MEGDLYRGSLPGEGEFGVLPVEASNGEVMHSSVRQRPDESLPPRAGRVGR